MTLDRRDLIRLASLAITLSVPAIALARGDGPAKPRIKIGQIGVGHAHASKLFMYRDSPDYEVV